MKNKLNKILLSLILTLSLLFSLTSCIAIDGIVGTGKELSAPVIAVDESKEIVYWEMVDGANRYNVTVNGNTETVKTTFYSYASLKGGVYEISVKALPSSSLDQPSVYSNKISITVGGISSGGDSSPSDDTNVDYVELINGITETVMQANVTVFTYMKKVIGNFISETSRAQGSGVIYKKRTTGYSGNAKYKYWVLTNNHVIYQDTTKYNLFEYTVTDIYNNEYDATLVAYDATYDLAVLTFEIEESEKVEFTPLNFASSNLSVGDDVISLGQPGGQKNSITLGEVVGFATPSITVNPNKAMSNVTFEVYRHNAPIKGGSSGGAILDYNYNIVGINYASSTDADGEYLSSFAVPLLKVKEFLLNKGVS